MPTFASLNGVRVHDAKITIPNYGIWMADVKIAGTPSVPTTPGACTLTAGDLVLVGTATRVGVYGGVASARIVGGFGGWRQPVQKPRSWHFAAGIPLAMVLGDVSSSVGEKVTGATGLLANDYALRAGDPASLVLHQLATPYWYMSPSGVTTVGQRPAATVASSFQLIDAQPESGLVVVSPSTLADWTPGNTFSTPEYSPSSPISFVYLDLPDSGAVRAEVLCV